MADAGASAGPVRPAVALGLVVVGFYALAIFGLGMTALALNADVIAVRGLGQVPGVVGMLLAGAGFAGMLWSVLRSEHPSYPPALLTGLAAWFGEVVGVFLGAVVTSGELALAAAAAGGIAVGWPGLVIAAAALVAAWSGIALVRTHASRPRWPWERRDED
jgi:hypothetical protein